MIFFASTDKETFPRFQKIEFYPYVVKNGINQKIIVAILDPKGIKEVKAEFTSDDKKPISISFSKIREEKEISEWEGNWSVFGVGKLTHYPIIFKAISVEENTEEMVAFFRVEPY